MEIRVNVAVVWITLKPVKASKAAGKILNKSAIKMIKRCLNAQLWRIADQIKDFKQNSKNF